MILVALGEARAADSDAPVVFAQHDASLDAVRLNWALHDAGAVENRVDRAAAALTLKVIEERLQTLVAEQRERDPDSSVGARLETAFHSYHSRVQLSLHGAPAEIESIISELRSSPISGEEFRQAFELAHRDAVNFVRRPPLHGDVQLPFLLQWTTSRGTDSDAFDLAEASLEQVRTAFAQWLQAAGSFVNIRGPLDKETLITMARRAIRQSSRTPGRLKATRDWESWSPRIRVIRVPLESAGSSSDFPSLLHAVTLPLDEPDAEVLIAASFLESASYALARRAQIAQSVEEIVTEGKYPPLLIKLYLSPVLCKARFVLLDTGVKGPWSDPMANVRESFDDVLTMGKSEESDDQGLQPPGKMILDTSRMLPETYKRRCLDPDLHFPDAPVAVSSALERAANVLSDLDWSEANILGVTIDGTNSAARPEYTDFAWVHWSSADPRRAPVARLIDEMMRMRPADPVDSDHTPPDEELELAQQLASEGASLALARWYAARTFAEAGQHERAMENFDAALAINAELVPALEGAFASAFEELGDAERALTYADRLVSLAPGFAPARLMRSQALQALGRHDEAHEELALFAESQPDDPLAWTALADYRRKHLRDLPRAVSAYLEAYRASQDRVAGQALPIAEMMVSARDAADPDTLSALVALVFGWEFPDEDESAREALIRVTGSSLTDTLGAHDLALVFFEELVKMAPSSARAWSLKGHAHEMLDDPESASTAYRRAVTENPAYGWAWCLLGDVQRDAFGDLENALESYTQCSENYGPSRRDLERARVLVLLGRYDEAGEAFKAHLEENPESEEAREEYNAMNRARRGETPESP